MLTGAAVAAVCNALWHWATEAAIESTPSCLPVQDPETGAAKMLTVKLTLKVDFSRVLGALHRAPDDKVRTRHQGP